jgi:hypothetical protein
MSLCAYCGHSTPGVEGVCSHHSLTDSYDWALRNRIMCDFVHRGVVPVRPIEASVDEESERILA